MIRVVHPGSGFLTIPDSGVKKAPDPVSGSATPGTRIWVVDQLPTRLHPMLWIRFWILNEFLYLETDFLLASWKSLAKRAGEPLTRGQGTRRQCCGSGMFVLDPNFSIPYPNLFHPGSASKNLSLLSQKFVSKLSEICSGLFIPDPYF
jgi:hypothetical protein